MFSLFAVIAAAGGGIAIGYIFPKVITNFFSKSKAEAQKLLSDASALETKITTIARAEAQKAVAALKSASENVATKL